MTTCRPEARGDSGDNLRMVMLLIRRDADQLRWGPGDSPAEGKYRGWGTGFQGLWNGGLRGRRGVLRPSRHGNWQEKRHRRTSTVDGAALATTIERPSKGRKRVYLVNGSVTEQESQNRVIG